MSEMSEMVLEATPRTETGKSANRKLRLTGQVPAVVYGVSSPLKLQVNAREAGRMVHQFHGSARMVTLKIIGDAKAEKQVLLKEIQTTAVGNNLIHIDFHEVAMNKPVHVTIEFHPTGTPEGVKFGGMLQLVRHDVIVECLPKDIPTSINADVSALEIGHSLHVKDIIFPPGVTPVTDIEETMIVIAAPRTIIEDEEVETAVAEEGAEDAATAETEKGDE